MEKVGAMIDARGAACTYPQPVDPQHQRERRGAPHPTPPCPATCPLPIGWSRPLCTPCPCCPCRDKRAGRVGVAGGGGVPARAASFAAVAVGHVPPRKVRREGDRSSV
ncbi:hypothetical protein NL676_022563 [Syzygium grande]|nr:hypothetical protein NL676_022563 [Syzygium grande]